MKRLFMSIVTLAAVAVAGVSCLQLEQPVLIENLSGDEIVFGADAHIEAQTKASSGTSETTSLSSFYVSAVTGSAGSESSAWTSTQFTQVTGSSPATYKGSKMWPASDQSYKFYASNVPLTFAAAGTTVSATNTTDVVCAYLTNGTYKIKNTLTFEHIFARFGRVEVAAESGYTISNISIRVTPKTGGTYNLRSGAGKTDGTGWSSVTTGSATVVANATGTNANDIYMVPGTYTLTVTWTATQGGASVTYTDKTVNVPVVAGKTNAFTLTLGGEIMFGVSVTEFTNYDVRDNLNYLTFYCDEAGTIGWKCSDASIAKTIQYSKDQGATWTSITSTTYGVSVSVSAGDIVWFKGSNSSYGNSDFYNCFALSNKAHVYGNVNSLTGDNTSVSAYCFRDLFHGCGSNLYTYDAKKIILPATTLANTCYQSMFDGCTSLTTAPELPATTLASSCYSGMFAYCTSLKTAPELPATTLASICYNNMFSRCRSLTTAPELPATTLANTCYQSMFYECTSLTTAPELPATTLAIFCYAYMFYGCTSLTTAPELPATTLAEYCYNGMFMSCTSLTSAPELPATTLLSNCYKEMFYGCSSLNYIKALFTTTPSSSNTSNWVSGVAATGTFVKNPEAAWNVVGVNGVPSGWTLYDKNYLKFKFTTDGSVAWQNVRGDILYSKNNGPWTTFNGTTVSMSAGDEIIFQGALTGGMGAGYEHTSSKFVTTGKFNASGDVRSLCSFSNAFANRHFAYLFCRCAGLEDASEIVLPSSSLTTYCFNCMFAICVNLNSAPELPATSLANSCYYGMFEECVSLVTPPELPASTLTSSCYARMFYGCSQLTSAPELNATSLATYCYQNMFARCFSLTEAPELPATSLANYCYYGMFSECSSLVVAPELPATTMQQACYYGMFQGCSQLASAPALPATTLAASCYYSMFQSCISLTTAPDLPAETLALNCYICMFRYCSSLNYIKALFTTTPSDSYTKNWVQGVAATGTFLKNKKASWDVTGNNGVPTGWTVSLFIPPVGKFTINATGEQVGFAPGNLWAHIASGPTNSYNFTADEWGFHENQWDYCNQSLAVGNTVDHFGWVGTSASYDTYGLCSYTSYNNAYYGTSSSDVLKTNWEDIPGVVSACGGGWFTLSRYQWAYVFSSRTTGGSVAGTANARYTLATIRTDVSGVNGVILFPDGVTFSAGEFTTVGTLNAVSAWTTKCTDAQWSALEAKGCVFLPASGYRGSYGLSMVGACGSYWSSTPNGAGNARGVSASDFYVNLQADEQRSIGYAVRLVKSL